MNLRERCIDFLEGVAGPERNFRAATDELEAFVVTEIGRAADERFDDAVPLALYFGSVADREEFVAAVTQAKPGMIAKRWPR